jgi:hypothetical protein
MTSATKVETFFEEQDRVLCETLLGTAAERNDKQKTLPELVLLLSRHFLGTPYEAETLERGASEALVVNLRAFDCVTFVENVIALALAIKSGATAFTDYLTTLMKIRYRNGHIYDYSSRLHYFTDWIWDNGRKGFLADITSRIGGIPVKKNLNQMTSHRNDHPSLRDDATFLKMQGVETSCARRTFYFIPKDRWRQAEEKIEDGDIMGITSNKAGIDVIHVGFASLVNRKVRLVHASSRSGAVVLSDATMNHYLRERSSRTGIIVARLTQKA